MDRWLFGGQWWIDGNVSLNDGEWVVHDGYLMITYWFLTTWVILGEKNRYHHHVRWFYPMSVGSMAGW